ncbi:hypothetical protein E2C01_085710 [Portunus trituberculatus]|uniref:Uncharacterized protein n=1 Tax=Portunus trituberculatus TaxID=210409 RepID=A0A5B7J8B1_PORTR|nr:hypothetical protein [Portunus trituberculatus]
MLMWNKIQNVCAGVAGPFTAATPSHRQLQVAIKGPSCLPAAPLLHRPQHAGWTNATGETAPQDAQLSVPHPPGAHHVPGVIEHR